MAFVNRVRLPVKITRPQFLEEREVFRKANGEIKVLSVVIRKQYEGETDLLPEKIHERIVIALAHNDVRIEGERYIGGVVKDGDYQISWVDFLDYPIAKATFKAFATPFNATNSNCAVCVDYIQLVANDDDVGARAEGELFDAAVLVNDAICCDPATLSLITTNSDVVQSITVIDGDTLRITLKTPLPNQNNVYLATYRVQCENGQYDEADVYASSITGSTEVCQTPLNLQVSNIDDDSATVAIFPPSPAPADGYEWELRIGLTVVQTGTTATNFINLSGLVASTNYTIYVRSVCGPGDVSGYINQSFTTDPPSGSDLCGNYEICYNDPDQSGGQIATFHYTDCNGDPKIAIVVNFNCRELCVLQNSPGDPVSLSANKPNTTITYLGLC